MQEPCRNSECGRTVMGPLPLCQFHSSKMAVPFERPTNERLAVMVESAIRWVPLDVADKLLEGWTHRELWHAWRHWKTDTRPAIPVAVKRAVYARDGEVCQLCAATERLSLDHIQPWSRGGKHTVENLRVLCMFCNVSRGAPLDWEKDLPVAG